MDMNRKDKASSQDRELDANRDPITGTPGAHPVGVGAGAASGGVAGGLIGAAVGGPIGAGVGAVVGAVSGGYAGKGIAEAIDPTEEHKYWRAEYSKRPYVTHGSDYGQYGPAYQYGWESYQNHQGKKFQDVAPELAGDWETRRGESQLSWNNAQAATRDAWLRAEKAGCDDHCSEQGAKPNQAQRSPMRD